MKRFFLGLAVFCACPVVPHAQAAQDEPASIPVETQADMRHVALAITEVCGMNIFLTAFNKFIREASYSDISLSTMKHNLTHAWVWDQDEFNINQIGHPYQGSFYFNAGRANGLGYWQSLALAAFGSATWEYLMENEAPSYNDLLVTSVSASLFGEVLHRLYLLAEKPAPWAAWLISPQDAFNRFVTGQRPPREQGTLTEASASLGGAFMLSDLRTGGGNESPHSKRGGMYANVTLVYEDPYAHAAQKPFDQFQVRADGFLMPGYFFVALSGDAPFFSWQLDTAADTVLGVSMNYDMIYATDINYQNNAIGVSLRQRRALGGTDWQLCWSGAVNGTFLGASEYYYLLVDNERNSSVDGSEQRLYDLGIGANAKAGVSVSHPAWGSFFADGAASFFWTIPASVPHDGSEGCNLVWYATYGYEHPVWQNLSVGLSEFLYGKRGFYKAAEDTSHFAAVTRLYAKYTF